MAVALDASLVSRRGLAAGMTDRLAPLLEGDGLGGPAVLGELADLDFGQGEVEEVTGTSMREQSVVSAIRL